MSRYYLVRAVNGVIEPHPDPVNLAGFRTASEAASWANGYDADRKTWDYTRELPGHYYLAPMPEDG